MNAPAVLTGIQTDRIPAPIVTTQSGEVTELLRLRNGDWKQIGTRGIPSGKHLTGEANH